jgi:hypothetical protein
MILLALLYAGLAHGEDSYEGHRLAHPVVGAVPDAQVVMPRIYV